MASHDRYHGGQPWWGEPRSTDARANVRPDAEIREDAYECLVDSGLDTAGVEVSVHEGDLTLSGHVGSRADRQRVEGMMDGIRGIVRIQNNLRVRREPSAPAG